MSRLHGERGRRGRSWPGGPAAILAAVLTALAALAASVAAQPQLTPTTPTQTGPWYQSGAPERADLWQPGLPGTRLTLRGRVLDVRGGPIDAALIEYWHTDALGNYPPLRASTRSKADGSFGIRTVLPGHNHGYRARHIHFILTRPGHIQLVTRIYFLGDKHMDEAPWPELAITLEESMVDQDRRLFGNVVFVMQPGS